MSRADKSVSTTKNSRQQLLAEGFPSPSACTGEANSVFPGEHIQGARLLCSPMEKSLSQLFGASEQRDLLLQRLSSRVVFKVLPSVDAFPSCWDGRKKASKGSLSAAAKQPRITFCSAVRPLVCGSPVTLLKMGKGARDALKCWARELSVNNGTRNWHPGVLIWLRLVDDFGPGEIIKDLATPVSLLQVS